MKIKIKEAELRKIIKSFLIEATVGATGELKGVVYGGSSSKFVEPGKGGPPDFESAGIKSLPNWPSPSPVNEDPSTMEASQQIIEDIKKSEGFIPHVYDDLAGRAAKKAGLDAYENSKGTPTIGYGEAIFASQKEKREKQNFKYN